MKILFIGDEKSLNIGELYKVRKVKKVNRTLFYGVEVNGEIKYFDSKQFKYSMNWLKD